MNDIVEIRKYIAVMLNWWWLLIVAIILGAFLGYSVSKRQTPIYQATATILVGRSIQSTDLDSRDIITSERLALSYADMAKRQPILETVARDLNLSASWRALASRVQAKPLEGTQLIEIQARANSPESARLIADRIAIALIQFSPTSLQTTNQNEEQQFVLERLKLLRANITGGQAKLEELQKVLDAQTVEEEKDKLRKEMSEVQSAISANEGNYARFLSFSKDQATSNYLSIIEEAHSSNQPIQPDTQLNMLMAALVGLGLAIGFIFVREHMNDTLESAADLSYSLGLPILGFDPFSKGQTTGAERLVTLHQPLSSAAETYRRICGSIQLTTSEGPPKSIMIASPELNEGKVVVAANLGVVVAQQGFTAILVDTSQGKPLVHQIFQRHDQIVRQRKDDLATKFTANSTKKFLDGLEDVADVVIFIGAPILTVAYGTMLSSTVDGVVLVFRVGQTRHDSARQAITYLEQVDTKILGGVLTEHVESPLNVIKNFLEKMSKRFRSPRPNMAPSKTQSSQ